MFDHIGLRFADLSRAARLYTAALAPLDYALCIEEEYVGLGPAGEPALWLYRGNPEGTQGIHLALRARNRAAVDAFHAAACKVGGRDNGSPGLRPEYGPNYYAAFVLDLSGNNLEAVCTR